MEQPIEVRVSSDDEAFQKKLDAVFAEIAACGGVVEAREARDAAAGEVARLKLARSRLSDRAREIFDELRNLSAALDDALIEDAGGDLSKKLKGLGALEAEHRAVLRASSRVVEHLLPMAEIAELFRESEHLASRARALRGAASERIRKTAEMLADAAEHEGGIVFDSTNTLSGEMQRQAEELERQAANYAQWAKEREEQYRKMAKELEALWTRK